MNDELNIAVTETTPSNAKNTYTFHQPGNGTNIGIAQTVKNETYNVYIPGNNPQGGQASQQQTKRTLNLEYYNLFVICGEKFENKYFMIDISRALTVKEGTSVKISNRLAKFDDLAIAEILTYPAIFANENYRYCNMNENAAEEQIAYYGIVTDIKQMNNGVLKIYYEKFPMCSIPQLLLNNMLAELDIAGHKKLNEFDRTHWSIKNVNLIEEMKIKGISLFIPSI